MGRIILSSQHWRGRAGRMHVDLEASLGYKVRLYLTHTKRVGWNLQINSAHRRPHLIGKVMDGPEGLE